MSRATAAADASSQEQKEAGSPLHVMERGHIYFLFRAKVDVEDAHSFKDVQKLFLWLSPERVEMADHVKHPIGLALGQPPASVRRMHRDAPMHADASGVKPKHRLLVLPHKKLPDSTTRQPHWAFVDEVADTVDEIKGHIGEFHYHTKTRGDRTSHASRIVAEGIYSIMREEGGQHTYMLYELEMPLEPEEPQHAFNIQKEGLILLQVKNPHASGVNREGQRAAGLSESAKPHYPKRLQDAFKGIRVPETKFASLEPEMLNYKGTELLLLGVKHAAKDVLGEQEVEYMEKMAELESVHGKKQEEKKLEAETGVDTAAALHKF